MSSIQFSSQAPNPDMPGVLDISVEELSLRLQEVHLVDVRRDDEYNADLGHIAGSQHIVLDTLPGRLNEIPKDKPIVFICRSGARSARASALASAEGFKNVFNMKGGMLGWNALGFKVERL